MTNELKEQLLNTQLKDNALETGGKAYSDYTLRDYLEETGLNFDILEITSLTVELCLDLMQSGLEYDNIIEQLTDTRYDVKQGILERLTSAIDYKDNSVHSLQVADVQMVVDGSELVNREDKVAIERIVIDKVRNHFDSSNDFEQIQAIVEDVITNEKFEVKE